MVKGEGAREPGGEPFSSVEEMGKGDLDSMESMQRTMKMCTAVGCILTGLMGLYGDGLLM
jgi:hypothetical protein